MFFDGSSIKDSSGVGVVLISISKEVAHLSFKIDFKTTSKSEAILWLTKEQTKGKNHPFMFTQCEAILARSLIPCQVTF